MAAMHYQATVRAIVREVRDGKKEGRYLWTAEDLARAVLPATRDVLQIREHLAAAKSSLSDPDIIGLTILAKRSKKTLAVGQDAESRTQAGEWIAGNLGGTSPDRLMWALFNMNGLPQDGPLAIANRERKLRVSRGSMEATIRQFTHALGLKGLSAAQARTEIKRYGLRFENPGTLNLFLEMLQLGPGDQGELESGE